MGLSSTPITPANAFTADLYPPQSGTAVLAADVEAGEQVGANRDTFLKARLGAYYLVHSEYASATPQSAGVYDSFTTTGYVSGADASNSLGPITMVSGDYVEVVFVRQFSVSAIGADTNGFLRIVHVKTGTPTVVDGAELETDLVRTGVQLGNSPSVAQFFATLAGTYSHTGATADITFTLQGKVSDATAGNGVSTINAGSASAHHYRTTA